MEFINVKLIVLFAGDEVKVVYIDGTDSTPLLATTTNLYKGFNGFRI